MSLRLSIAVGPGERLFPSALICLLADIWRQRGHQIEVTSARKLAGDIGFLHIDTTHIAANMVPSCPPGMPLLNGRAIDISKRTVSRNLVTPSDDYTGPVMVKTNNNYCGLEAFPRLPAKILINRLRKIVSLRNWRQLRVLPRNHYPVLPNKTEVPAWVWQRSDLVVERFLPEIEDDLFVLRCWVFLGQREFGVKLCGRDPVVKAGSAVHYEYISGVPDPLRAERERLGFDFGKFDYVIHDGTTVLLDANKTPVSVRSKHVTPQLLDLADGIGDFGVMH
jgi:hypothetical protein